MLLFLAENPALINFLSFEELHFLCLSSKACCIKFEPERDLVVLLKATFQGNEVTVHKLLEKNPALLMMRRSLIDNVGREFEFITFCQYSIWAYDADMIRTMLECLSQCNIDLAQKIQTDLNKQIKALRSGEIKCTKDNIKVSFIAFEKSDLVKSFFDFSRDEEPDRVKELFELLRDFKIPVDRGLRAAGDDNADWFSPPALHASWIRIAKIFRDSPVHFIQSYHVVEEYFDDDHDNSDKPDTQDFFRPERYHFFDDDDKLAAWLFKIRTPRSEPFYYNWSKDNDKKHNRSWFGQEKDCGLGYDFGLTAPFCISDCRRGVPYYHGVMLVREYKEYPHLMIRNMFHALFGFNIVFTMRDKEIQILLESLTRPIEELQAFLNTLPVRKDISEYQYVLPRYFSGPSFWSKKQTQTEEASYDEAQTRRCCTIS